MDYKSKLHKWLKNATVSEQESIARKANVKRHYIQRLARKEIKDPGLFTVRRILAAIHEHTIMQPDDRLPEIRIDDI